MTLAMIGLMAMPLVGSPPAAIARPAPSVAGTWTGPFLGSNFTFELKQTNGTWSGRYTSDKARKWSDLQDVAVAGGTVRFSFVSQPPSSFQFALATDGTTLTGTARFGPNPPIPLTLKRAS